MAAALVPGPSGASRSAEALPRFDLPLLDLLRILASVAVVRHHMRVDFLFGVGFGLPLFLVIMLGLVAGSSKRETVASFAGRKARYFLVPWLRWSLVYVVILAVADQVRGIDPRDRFEPGMLFYGGEGSLWFLPFAALAMLPLKLLQREASKLTPFRAAVFAGGLGLLATGVATWALTLPLPDMPVRAWLRVAPAVFWGLAAGQSVRTSSARARAVLLLSVAVLAVAACGFSALGSPSEDLPRRFAVSVPLACAGFGWRTPLPDAVRRLSTATFGVYLVHPLIGKILGSSFDVFAWPAGIHTGVVWVLAVLAVLGLRRLSLPWHELFTGRGAVHEGPKPRPALERRAA